MTIWTGNWPPELFEMIGVAGFVLYVLNYGLITIKWLNSDDISYFLLNWLAASFVLVGLIQSFNLASALIQIFWIGISTVAIVIRLRDRRRAVQIGSAWDEAQGV